MTSRWSSFDLNFIVVVVVSIIISSNSTQLYAQYISSSKVNTNPVIVIDPGHGGKDSGCNGHNYNEKHVALSLSKDIAKQLYLIDPDIEIIFTRTEDTFISLSERASIANSGNADMFISVHANSIAIENVRGSETFVYGPHLSEQYNSDHYTEIEQRENGTHTQCEHIEEKGPESWILAATLQSDNLKKSIELATDLENQLSQLGGHKSRGVKQANFAVLKSINIPSVLLEAGYLTNEYDFNTLTNKNGRNKIAQKIAEGISKYLQKHRPIRSNTSDIVSHKLESQNFPDTAIIEDDDNDYILVIASSDNQNFKIQLENIDIQRSRIIQNKQGHYEYAVGQYKSISKAELDKRKMIDQGYVDTYISTIKNVSQGNNTK